MTTLTESAVEHPAASGFTVPRDEPTQSPYLVPGPCRAEQYGLPADSCGVLDSCVLSAAAAPSPAPVPVNRVTGAFGERTWRSAGYLTLGVFTGILALVTFIVVVSLGATVAALVIGLPLLLPLLALSRGMAEVERRRAGTVLGAPVAAPYVSAEGGPLRQIWQRVSAPVTWRELGHHLLLFPVALTGWVVSLSFWATGLAGLTLWAWYWALPNGQAPIIGVDHGESLFLVDSFTDALPWVGVGLAFCWAAGWITQGAATMTASFTRFLLGPSQTEA